MVAWRGVVLFWLFYEVFWNRSLKLKVKLNCLKKNREKLARDFQKKNCLYQTIPQPINCILANPIVTFVYPLNNRPFGKSLTLVPKDYWVGACVSPNPEAIITNLAELQVSISVTFWRPHHMPWTDDHLAPRPNTGQSDWSCFLPSWTHAAFSKRGQFPEIHGWKPCFSPLAEKEEALFCYGNKSTRAKQHKQGVENTQGLAKSSAAAPSIRQMRKQDEAP